jgi:hypothetical protein
MSPMSLMAYTALVAMGLGAVFVVVLYMKYLVPLARYRSYRALGYVMLFVCGIAVPLVQFRLGARLAPPAPGGDPFVIGLVFVQGIAILGIIGFSVFRRRRR